MSTNDAQAARVAETRMQALLRLGEWDIGPGQPIRNAGRRWVWPEGRYWLRLVNASGPDRAVVLGLDGRGTLSWAIWECRHRLAGGEVERDGGRDALRRQVDAVRDALGWLRSDDMDSGCEGAR